jgi:hypothetical protein
MKATLILSAVVSCSFVSAALADDLSPERRAEAERLFKIYDTDSDGAISLEEFRAGQGPNMAPSRVPKVFAEKDLNKDGKLNLDEFIHTPADQRPTEPDKNQPAKSKEKPAKEKSKDKK